jgi:divalent metal cation (Fe/Co/Zn/Cd) transporter
MPFREKSAWIMSIALLLGAFFYYRSVFSAWSDSGQLASPAIPQIVAYTGILIAIAIIGHVVTAALAPKDSNVSVDERERQIFNRAGHYSSYVFVAGIVISLGIYVVSGSGDLLFYTVFASLIAAQIVEYAFQILFYRTSI